MKSIPFDEKQLFELRDLQAEQLKRIGKKEKSLAVLSTGFIRLFFS